MQESPGDGLDATRDKAASGVKRLKAFTVTIAGSEREDGEEPYTWVVEASDITSAISKATDHHARSQEERVCDLELVPRHTFEGVPCANCGYHWNDLRTRESLHGAGEEEVTKMQL
ncbi:hypothetical protein GCM10009733_039010 [Nonomuraea maheshkhaliensis]|uniref:Uncharacterized protein n=1 Tax=Nonomuraea maheshkhaliensis TaxID=419590 RepID=A0ABN2FAJ3_9ACTN